MTVLERILVVGYFGFDNAGDEAILEAVLCGIERVRPGVRAIVTSGKPAATRDLHGVDAVLWNDIGSLVEAARQVEVIVVGGGGLFQDHWEFDPASLLSREYSGIAFFSTAALLSSLFAKPLVVLGVGVGPLYSEAAREYTRMVFDQAVAATVRDEESKELVVSLGIAPEKVRLTADPVFLLEPPEPSLVTSVLRENRLSPGRGHLLGVALREWDIGAEPESWEAQVAKALDTFVERHGARVLFIPFQVIPEYLSNDLALAGRIRDRMQYGSSAVILSTACGPREKVAALVGCRTVLAMRLHAVLFAAKAGVPTVALLYDQKVEHAMRRLAWEDQCLDLGAVTAERLAGLLDAAVTGRDELRRRAAAAIVDLKTRARENEELVGDLMGRIQPSVHADSPELVKAFKATALARALDADTQNRLARSLRSHAATARAEAKTLRIEQRALVAERRALMIERDQLAARLADRELILHRITDTKSFALADAHWRLRRRVRARRERARARRTRGQGVPDGLTNALKRLLRRMKPMSYYAYAFDAYKRNRERRYRAHLGGVRCPTEPGLVSIVLPVYNGLPMVREAIGSILAQTYERFELICINDGSTDGTGEVLDEYAASDGRVRVVHQENRKIPRTLSRGFEMARGEFLTWTSADNRLKPDFLERMVETLRRRPDWDMAFANLDIIGDDGEPLRDSPWYSGYQVPPGSEHVHLPIDVSELNSWPNNYVGAAFLYRDRVAWALGNYSRIRFTTEDYDYWMRVNEFLTLRHVDFSEPVYDYRFHDRSLTARDEELGITRSRVNLMVFDDFRRDLSLGPVLWQVSPESGAAAQRLGAGLRESIAKAGHLEWVRAGPEDAGRLPRLWLPAVYVHVVEEPGAAGAPPEDLPEAALRVLVVAGLGPLPDLVDMRWDLCVAAGSRREPLPRLAGPHRGWLEAADAAVLFTFLDIRAKSRQLREIEREIESERADPLGLRASVVVWTCHEGERLERAVASVAGQTLDPDQYEIVVVNNTTDDPVLRRQIDELQGRYFEGREARFRSVLCPFVGLSHARNAGISEARGRIVCFLDDDAIAREDWLAEVCRAFDKNPDAGVVGGHILLRPADPPPKVLNPGWDRYWSHFRTGYDRATEVRHWWDYPWGANWSARRLPLLETGGFRSRYGRRGADFSGGEEIVAASLIQRIGYSVMVAPRAEVYHDVEPSRYSFRHVRRTIIAGTLINYQAQRDLYLPMESSVWSTLRRLLNPALDRTVGAHNAVTRLRHWLYRREAWLRLLRRQLHDLGSRMRRPLGRTSLRPASPRSNRSGRAALARERS